MPDSSSSTTSSSPTNIDDYDQQWEVLKAGIPGYEDPVDKAKRLKREQNIAEQKNGRDVAAVTRPRCGDNNPLQMCHSCGWTGTPISWQRCPACGGRDILSDASTASSTSSSPSTPSKSSGLNTDDSEHENIHVMPMEYEDDEDDHLMDLEEEVEVHVAADTGSVAHVVGPKDIPGSIAVRPPANGRVRNFVGAGGDGIKNHGEAVVQLVLEDGTVVNSTVQVADVVRPLHSVSMICDAEHEMLYTKACGYVVPEGTLSKFLASINVIAKYPRRGGLYVAKMKARRPRPKPAPSAAKPGFTRPGRRS